MFKWLFNNISIKIGSIVIAALLWFHVASEQSVLETINAPLVFHNVPEKLIVVNEVEDEVRFQIRTKVKQLILLMIFGKPLMKVSLLDATVGKNTVKLSKDWIVLPSWRPLEITMLISPQQIELELEERAEKKVSVKSVLKGSPTEGVFVKQVTLEPDSIVLISGKKRMRKIKEIQTDTIDITNLQKDFSVEKRLRMPETGYSSATEVVTVNVYFERFVTKTLTGVKITLKGEGNYEIIPELLEVTVQGPESLLKNLAAVDIKAYVEAKKVGGNIIPFFNLPEGCAFKTCNPQRVEVRLK
ncbi:MAG: hypothetical protein E3J78_05490 [Candidatus Cloacimonadota bacterium]|nr:MAG: hypothetical protein E3J78_05490 [Candidatus Cloacimonadota bacterium]